MIQFHLLKCSGYCEILNQLTAVESVDKKKFESRFHDWQLAKDVYYIVVIEDIKKKRIIGAASLIVEKKMIHSAAKVTRKFTIDLQTVWAHRRRSSR